MGQGQNASSNPILKQWQAHPIEPNTYVNVHTKDQAQSFLVSLNKNQQAILKKRMQENHNFIVKILYFEPAQKIKAMKDETNYYVYAQKTYPLTKNNYVPLTFSLSILKGFRRLSSNYGLMRISPNMIRVNDKNQIRVWINESPVKSEIAQRAENQELLLADIVKIIMEFDGQTGALMMKCTSINEAINNILHSMTENKNQPHYSNRTSKNEDKVKNTSREAVTVAQPKNNFRSTKETEDDSLKPFNENSLKNQRPEPPSLVQLESPKNYMQNVVIPKGPSYINVDRFPLQSDQKIAQQMSKNLDNESNRDINYSQQNNMQKQSSIQFNSSHPTKMVASGRPYKPVQYKGSTFTDTMNNSSAVYSQQFSPTYDRVSREPEKYSEKYEMLVKPHQFSVHQPERKSNLNKNYLERMEMSQESEMGSYPKAKGSFAIEKAEINTSRDFMDTHSFTRPRYGEMGGHFDASRTKTQEFYSTNTQLLGSSPRIRTHHLQQNSQMQRGMLMQSGMASPKANPLIERSPFQTKIPDYPKTPEFENNPHRNSDPEDDKKQIKLKQAQRIKQEMSSLGILNNTVKELTNDKSNRDLLIKQKIEEKNKKHEELKFAITRLLSQ